MQLFIDGVPVEALPGESLRDIIQKLALDTEELQTRPLAARIAGEVFTLNYIPLRRSDSVPDNPSVRRAMAASGGQVHLLRYSDGAGKKVYTRTACFLIFLGIPATMLYNLLSGIIRSLGDSRTPLYFLIFSSLLNVILDLAFIAGLGMGTAGASLATLLSQLISGLLCLWYMAGHFPILKMSREDLRPERSYILRLLAMGLPMGMQYSITAIGSILLQTAVNTLGAAAMAAMTAGSKVSMFAVCPFDAIGSTAATFAGQNIGAGKPERVHQGVRDASILGITYSGVILLVLAQWGGGLASIFLDAGDVEAARVMLPMSRRFLLCNACFYVPLLYVNLLRFTIQGLGFSNLAVLAGVFEMAARAVFGLCLVPYFGFDAVCFASPTAWVMADLFLFPAYYACLKKRGYQPRRQIHGRLVKAKC